MTFSGGTKNTGNGSAADLLRLGSPYSNYRRLKF